MDKPIDISIIIVSYNVKDLLLKCIDSIYQFTNERFKTEIVIVDNNSSDDSVKEVSSKYPEIKLVMNNYNAGFSMANNQGIELSSGKYLFLLNPDTEFKSDIFTFLFASISQNEKQIIAPQLLNSDGSLQVSCHKFPGLLSVILETFFLHSVFKVYNYSTTIFTGEFHPDWAAGAALFFLRESFNTIGLLDPDLFWMDDVDFCYRASKSGIRISYLPKASLYHHSGKSSEKNLSVTISNQLISKAKYLLKHNSKIVSSIALIFIFIHIISRIVLFFFLSPLNVIYTKKFKAYTFTFRKYFNYLFNADKSIIR